MRIISKIITYFRESKIELKKVIWPSKRETISYTLLVIGISAGVGLFFVILDYVFSTGVERIIRR